MMGYVTGMVVGMMWGFIIFDPWPKDIAALKKQGAIAVYEGHARCEKALSEWVCDMKAGQPARGGE